MKNIIWQTPDGGIAVTHIAQHAVDRMERACLIASVPEDERLPEEQLELDFVRENMGLDEHEHELLLMRRTQADLDAGRLKQRPEILDYVCVGHSQPIPSDDSFRDAWRWNGTAIEHDMEKCRAIHRDRLRRARAPKFPALDVEYQRADEAGDSEGKLVVAEKKQALRDATEYEAIDQARNIDDLKKAIPECLHG